MGYTIGRGTDNHIVINHNSVSRRHAELLIEDEHIIVQDTGSKNGTYLISKDGSVAINRAIVTMEDVLVFGKVKKSVREIIDTLTDKHIKVIAKKPIAAPSGVKKVRCICGAVKEAGSMCAVCGNR